MVARSQTLGGSLMWMKLDDSFFDHPKFFTAGEHLGKRGRQRAICIWLEGLGWTNKHYTDGFIPDGVIQAFRIDDRPVEVAVTLARADVRLWHRDTGGYRMHDYHDHNPAADKVKEKLKRDRERKRKRRSEQESVGIPNGFRADSTALARAYPDPNPSPSTEDHGRAARAVCAKPVENKSVLKALIWREIDAAYTDPEEEWSIPSLTERVKCCAAKAKLIYAVDFLHHQIELAMDRVEQRQKRRA